MKDFSDASMSAVDERELSIVISELFARIVSMELSSEYALTKQED